MFSKKLILPASLVLTLLIMAYSTLFIFKGEKLIFWVKEDGFFETLGAVMYLFASIILIYLYVKSISGNNFYIFTIRRNLFLLLLGLLFFFCFGEEISWGQRIFNIETPEKIKEINRQGEINIHNLNFFHALDENDKRKEGVDLILPRLFSLFWFLYCFVMPLLNHNIKRISNFLKTINLPIVPFWIGIMFPINYILSKGIEKTNIFLDNQPIVEIKEGNFGMLYFIVGLTFYQILKKEITLKTKT